MILLKNLGLKNLDGLSVQQFMMIGIHFLMMVIGTEYQMKWKTFCQMQLVLHIQMVIMKRKEKYIELLKA